MLKMNEGRVKQILGHHDPRLQQIHKRILAIHDELLDADSLVESVSMKKIEWDREGSVSGGIKKDLTEVMLTHQRLVRERELDLRGELYQLAEEEEAINRIWTCFRALCGKEYIFLEKLYVQGMPYKTVEMESGVSHKTFETYRRSGMRKILKMYQSDFTNLEIAARSRPASEEAKTQEEGGEKRYVQLKLNI